MDQDKSDDPAAIEAAEKKKQEKLLDFIRFVGLASSIFGILGFGLFVYATIRNSSLRKQNEASADRFSNIIETKDAELSRAIDRLERQSNLIHEQRSHLSQVHTALRRIESKLEQHGRLQNSLQNQLRNNSVGRAAANNQKLTLPMTLFDT